MVPIQIAATATFPTGEAIIVGNLARHEDPNLLGARVVGPAVEIKIVDTESGDEILRPNRPATISLPFDPELFGPGTQRGDVFIGLLDRASGTLDSSQELPPG